MDSKLLQAVISILLLVGIVGCGSIAAPTTGETQPPQSSETTDQALVAPTTTPTPPTQLEPTVTTTLPLVTATITLSADLSLQPSLPLEVAPIPTPSSLALQALVDQAETDLAGKLNMNKAEISLVGLEFVVWPDGGLGCPQPNMAYTQVQVEGMLIQLQADNQIYNYHSGDNRPPFLCKESTQSSQNVAPASPIEPKETVMVNQPEAIPAGFENLVTQAQTDLAQRLSISTDQIAFESAESVVWPDGSMGCPQPGMAYTQVLRDGARIRLRVGQQVYNYHSGGNRPPFLCENAAKGDELLPPPGFND